MCIRDSVYTALTNTDLNTLQTEGKWYYAGGGNTCTNVPVAVSYTHLNEETPIAS